MLKNMSPQFGPYQVYIDKTTFWNGITAYKLAVRNIVGNNTWPEYEEEKTMLDMEPAMYKKKTYQLDNLTESEVHYYLKRIEKHANKTK